MRSEAKRTGQFASLGLTLLAVILLAVWFGPTASDNPAEANDAVAIGIDTNTSGNTALALSTLQACRVIATGAVIDMDLYIQGVSDIASWEAYIKYDTSKIAISKPGSSSQGNNARFLLQQAQPSPPGNNLNNTSHSLPDTDGRYLVGAYDQVVIPGVQDPYPGTNPAQHSDGVLVRLEIQGLPGLGGFTSIQISPFSTQAGMVGPFVKDSGGNLIGDGNGDGFLDNVTNGAIVVGTGTCADGDGDGVPDTSDNCPTVSNANQANFDGDADGDACDIDDDNDGLIDTSEPTTGCTSGTGGRLDPDCDNDNVSDGPNDPDGGGAIVAGPDNCLTTANTSQTNTDGDSQGDACDTDDDNDGVLDPADNCPLVSNISQTNTDGDSQGDACDSEDDGDGFDDAAETWVGTLPLDPCGNPTSTSPIMSQSWPADLAYSAPFSENKIDVLDLSTYIVPVRRINTSPGDEPAYDRRWDISPGNSGVGEDINILDLTVLVTVSPLMLGSVRAFNGPACTP